MDDKKNKNHRYLTPRQEAEILAAGISKRSLPAFRKGKPYVLPEALITYRMENGTLSRFTYSDSKEQAAALARWRNAGIPLSKMGLKVLQENQYKLSPQEESRANNPKSKRN